MMNHTYGWMSGGLGGPAWIWPYVIGVALIVLLVILYNKRSKNKS